MKSKYLTLVFSLTLFAPLADPVRLVAQQQPEGSPSVTPGIGNPVPLINQPLVPDAAIPGRADNAPDSLQIVSLAGASPVVELNPPSLAFGSLMVGQRWTLRTVMTNVGNTTLHITSIKNYGMYFSESNSCGSSLPPQQSCDIWVTFAPRVLGMFNGGVSISDNGVGSPQHVSLSGTGVQVVNCYKYSCFTNPHCPPGCYCHTGCFPLGDNPVDELLGDLSPMTSFGCDATRQLLHLDDGVH